MDQIFKLGRDPKMAVTFAWLVGNTETVFGILQRHERSVLDIMSDEQWPPDIRAMFDSVKGQIGEGNNAES